MHGHNSFGFTERDREQLDKLIGAAILDETVCRRLLDERDKSLYDEYELSALTQAWLRAIHTPTLARLADAILSFERRSSSSREDHFASLTG